MTGSMKGPSGHFCQGLVLLIRILILFNSLPQWYDKEMEPKNQAFTHSLRKNTGFGQQKLSSDFGEKKKKGIF